MSSASPKAAKRRLDVLLHERGLAASREKAQALILAGSVLVNQQKAGKPGQSVAEDAAIELLGQTRFVSRGGLKLEAALDHFGIDVTGLVCLDVGTSTGGFTDCLLQRGAARVHAIDVGPSQMDWRLRQDPRVVVHDHTNARYVEPELTGEPAQFAAFDLSFISTTLVLAPVSRLLAAEASLVILVKPQFEVGREQVGKGGIVRDPALHAAACQRVREATEELGYVCQLIPCPVLGAEGNQEFLLYGKH